MKTKELEKRIYGRVLPLPLPAPARVHSCAKCNRATANKKVTCGLCIIEVIQAAFAKTRGEQNG